MSVDRLIPVLTRNHSGWQVPHLTPILGCYLKVFDESEWNYAPKDALVLCNPSDLADDSIIALADQGRKIVVDNIWDGHSTILQHPFPLLELRIDSFFWIHEYGWHRYHNLDQVRLQPTYQYTAFMPMRHARYFRQATLEKFRGLLPDMIWSYEDRSLPHDQPNRPDRHFVQEWYDKTAMSVVVETVVDTVLPFPLLSEKIFKPIIFGHPFLLLGCQGSLAWLHDHGFVTYDNIFDESYDDIDDWNQRLDHIYRAVCKQGKTSWDDETRRRIAHNRSVFFDEQKIRTMAEDKIIKPIRDWYETR